MTDFYTGLPGQYTYTYSINSVNPPLPPTYRQVLEAFNDWLGKDYQRPRNRTGGEARLIGMHHRPTLKEQEELIPRFLNEVGLT